MNLQSSQQRCDNTYPRSGGPVAYCLLPFKATACRSSFTEVVSPWQLQDVGTVDSGLNSTVLASNNEMVILPVNEPTFGTRRKSQIQVQMVAKAPLMVQVRLCTE